MNGKLPAHGVLENPPPTYRSRLRSRANARAHQSLARENLNFKLPPCVNACEFYKNIYFVYLFH